MIINQQIRQKMNDFRRMGQVRKDNSVIYVAADYIWRVVIKREVIFMSNNKMDKSVVSNSWTVWGGPQCGSKTKNKVVENKQYQVSLLYPSIHN
jgi:hypothetical protein